jgi:hypothetical protein
MTGAGPFFMAPGKNLKKRSHRPAGDWYDLSEPISSGFCHSKQSGLFQGCQRFPLIGCLSGLHGLPQSGATGSDPSSRQFIRRTSRSVSSRIIFMNRLRSPAFRPGYSTNSSAMDLTEVKELTNSWVNTFFSSACSTPAGRCPAFWPPWTDCPRCDAWPLRPALSGLLDGRQAMGKE